MIVSCLDIADCAAWGARLNAMWRSHARLGYLFASAAHAVAMEIMCLELTA